MENHILLGGCPVKTSGSQLSKTRFENLVVPLGIHSIPFLNELYILQDDEEFSLINKKKYDDLFFSVGSDLGKMNSNNKTKKKQK